MKKAKNNVNADKTKIFIKRSIKLVLFLILFFALMFLVLYVNSYFWLESLKLDMGEEISEMFKNMPRE